MLKIAALYSIDYKRKEVLITYSFSTEKISLFHLQTKLQRESSNNWSMQKPPDTSGKVCYINSD